MDLQDLITKETQLQKEEALLYQEIAQIRIELQMLHEKAIKDGFVWESVEKKWYKEVKNNA